MTPIQYEAITPIMEGRDVVAQSKTGSGKTLAFGLPCVVSAETDVREPQTLIITPTRELAEQIAVQLRSVASYRSNLKIVTLYGGVPLRGQADSIAKGVQIIIGTPGRLMDHLGKGTLDLRSIRRLVLDEADRMLDMGFGEDIEKIVRQMRGERQTLLFSATFPDATQRLASALLSDPLHIAVDTQQPTQIEEIVYETQDKERTLDELIGLYRPESLLIFCNTKAEVIAQAARLERMGHSVAQIHGDLDQRQRQESVIAFANGSRRILVATDVASRGLDIEGIALVVNYDLPFDPDVYTHRIGRTGRADAAGEALSLYAPHESSKCDYITDRARRGTIDSRQLDRRFVMESKWATLCINGGKRQKLRPGDILGTLSKGIGIAPDKIGKITITETISYVALSDDALSLALKGLGIARIKKKRYKGWVL
jgi:ATP-independent RNA helicase DbpA